MEKLNRRSFLAATGATGLSASPSLFATIASALAIPAHSRTNSIQDVEHVVVLMQENRSFDSYWGTLVGVRGFNDPRAIQLPSGKPVWYQPNGATHVLPYHFDISNTNALRIGLNHSWKGSEKTWKNWDAWVAQKSVRSMGYFDRGDLPYYYALGDAFTVCDAYHCSVFGPTDPNRFYALSGHAPGNITGIADSRLYNVNNNTYNADITNDNQSAVGISWSTYAETLEANGVSWKVYQEWDNYGDNYLQYFKNFRVDANGARLTPASPLYKKARALATGSTASNAAGTTGQWLIDQFAADVRAGTLPQVSYICAPTEYCEHPEETPNAGENFTARLLAALVDNPDVWAKTVLILTYDENDGFFDHMPSNMVPLTTSMGRTTLTNATQGEVHAGESIGLGPRVPTMVISPWSKGGRVCSELFDHTSLIRFMEEWLVQGRGLPRANVSCPHISPWRRAVCGDMTRAFNFATPNTDWVSTIPRTAVYFKGWGTADALPPAVQSLAKQEALTAGSAPRAACPLGYRMELEGSVSLSAKKFSLNFVNSASSAMALIVYSSVRTDGPWHYTVGAGKRIDNETWTWSGTEYHLAAHGPNGYLREFKGKFSLAGRGAEVSVVEDAATRAVRVTFTNKSASSRRFNLVDKSYGNATVVVVDVPVGQTKVVSRSVVSTYGWYDLGIGVEGDASYVRRYAGHVEGAGLDYTDPVLNGLTTIVLPPEPVVGFSSGAAQVSVGQPIVVTWNNLAASPTNWIGLYRVGDVPGTVSSTKWSYATTSAGSVSFTLTAAGDYFIALFLNDGYQEAATRIPLRILA